MSGGGGIPFGFIAHVRLQPFADQLPPEYGGYCEYLASDTVALHTSRFNALQL